MNNVLKTMTVVLVVVLVVLALIIGPNFERLFGGGAGDSGVDPTPGTPDSSPGSSPGTSPSPSTGPAPSVGPSKDGLLTLDVYEIIF